MDTVTPNQAVVTYSWGDFKHDPIQVLAKYFDAFLYASNFGLTRLAFRFPAHALDSARIEPYLLQDAVTVSSHGAFTVLEIALNDEGGGDYVDVEDLLGRLATVRQQLIDGDDRALYLAWLAQVSLLGGARRYWSEELEEGDEDGSADDLDDLMEPPVPPGLAQLDGGLAAQCELFQIDALLVKAAADHAPPPAQHSPNDLRAAVAALPRHRVDDYFLRLLDSEPQLASALRKELRLTGSPSTSDAQPRSARVLLAEAERLRTAHQRRQAEQERQARIAELEKLASRKESASQAVDTLLRQQKASSYDAALRHLIDLRDLARYRDRLPDFQARLDGVIAQYGKSRALMNRLRNAHLAT